MDNDAGLTNDQTEKVLQFQDVTGIQDMNVCRDVLTRHQWNLEIAIQEQLNINEGRPTMFAAAADESRAPQVINDRYLQTVFTNSVVPDAPAPGLTGLVSYFVNYLFRFCYTTITSILTTLLDLFKPDARTIVTDPLGDVLQFIRQYTEKYNPHPVFYQGTYAQALNDAKRELKFLAVYLHSEKKNAAEVARFCQTSLSHPETIEYLNRNTLLWGCDVSTPEGFRVANTMSANCYPLIIIIGLRDNKLTLMGRLEGTCAPDVFLGRVKQVVKENEMWLNLARSDRLERSFTQTLRLQQDEAYEESLRADQEKERLKELAREEIRQQEQAIVDELQAVQDRKAQIAREKLELLAQVQNEPAEDAPDTLLILFKLPDGTRIQRRFFCRNSLKDVFNFIFCHPLSPDSFELTTNFPKRVLQSKDSSADQTVSQAGLKHRDVLFVNDLDA